MKLSLSQKATFFARVQFKLPNLFIPRQVYAQWPPSVPELMSFVCTCASPGTEGKTGKGEQRDGRCSVQVQVKAGTAEHR